MHPRCSLVFLFCSVLVCLNLIFDELLNIDQRDDAVSLRSLPDQPTPELFSGTYVLRTNGSQVLRGTTRVALRSQKSGLRAVHVVDVVITLLSGHGASLDTDGAAAASAAAAVPSQTDGGGVGSSRSPLALEDWFARKQDAILLLKGIEAAAAHRMAASGVSDPGASLLFGESPCPLDGVLDIRGGGGGEALGGTPRSGGAAATIGSSTLRSVPLTSGGSAVAAVFATGGRGGDGGAAAAAAVAAAAGGVFPHAAGFDAEVVSPDCGFSLGLAVHAIDIQRVEKKVFRYAMWANLLTALQIRLFLAQMRHTEEGPSAARLSMVGIAAQALMDGYDSFLHLSLTASSEYMFKTFAVVSLFKFVLFSLLEVRYLILIWRVSNQDMFAQGWETVRRELSRVYAYFYGSLIVGLVIIFSFSTYLDVIALLFQAYWVPQILYDVRKGSRNSLMPQFLVGMTVTRCLGLLYLWGCPSGVFNGEIYPEVPGAPNSRLCAAAVLFQMLQVAILSSQRLLGPRWFVPWICMPNIYNYGRPAQLPPNTECVICMGDVGSGLEGQRRVVTPCDHNFHRACLERWMDVKMECPTCRADLPPIC